MHGLTGGGWKRMRPVKVTAEEAARRGNPGKEGCRTYRRPAPPRQPPTLLRHGVSAATVRYLDQFTRRRVTRWLLKRHSGITWKELYRRFLTGRPGRRPAEKGLTLFNPQSVQITRYRWRANRIPTPWTSNNMTAATAAT